jgi:hypothetical protein
MLAKSAPKNLEQVWENVCGIMIKFFFALFFTGFPSSFSSFVLAFGHTYLTFVWHFLWQDRRQPTQMNICKGIANFRGNYQKILCDFGILAIKNNFDI